MGADMSFEIKNIKLDEMNYFIKKAEMYGWNPGQNDAIAFYNTDPNGFFIAELDNQPIGCISAVSYNDEFGFIGFYVMDEKYAGHYYGASLGIRATKYLNYHIIGLDGVIDRIENYKRLGFKYAYANARYEFIKPHGFQPEKCNEILNYSDKFFDEIAQYDMQCFPVERKTFLKNWLIMPNAKVKLILDNGSIRGYGVIRKCIKGYKIGPLFADDLLPAESLLVQLLDSVSAGEYIYFDIPEVNDTAKYLTQKYNMTKVFETARMYSGDFPNIDLDKVFGITSFELG